MDWRGFELHPETPVGGMQIADLFPASRLEGMREYMKRFALQFGVTDMGAPERLPNTRRVLAIAELARDEGRLDAFREAAMEAHWRDGMDLEDDADLQALAARAGISPHAALRVAGSPVHLARVDALRAEAMAAGVTGIPTFLIDAERVVGCQPYEVLAHALSRARQARRERPNPAGPCGPAR